MPVPVAIAAIRTLERPALEVGDRRLLAFRTALLGDVQQLREVIGLRAQRLDKSQNHGHVDERPVRSHVALDQRGVLTPAHRLPLIEAALDILYMGELEDRVSEQGVGRASEQRAEGIVHARDDQRRREDHHADRRVLGAALEPPTRVDRLAPARPLHDHQPDQGHVGCADRDRPDQRSA